MVQSDKVRGRFKDGTPRDFICGRTSALMFVYSKDGKDYDKDVEYLKNLYNVGVKTDFTYTYAFLSMLYDPHNTDTPEGLINLGKRIERFSLSEKLVAHDYIIDKIIMSSGKIPLLLLSNFVEEEDLRPYLEITEKTSIVSGESKPDLVYKYISILNEMSIEDQIKEIKEYKFNINTLSEHIGLHLDLFRMEPLDLEKDLKLDEVFLKNISTDFRAKD